MSRRALTTLIALGLSSGAALAADLDAAPEQLDMGSISPPNAGARWEGFYFGGTLGAQKSSGQTGSQFWWPNWIITDQPYSVSLPTTGGSLGLEMGFDKQFGPLVVGLAVDDAALFGSKATYSGAGGLTSVYQEFPTGSYTSSFSQELDSFGSFRARVGYAPNSDWMVYATGGLAFGNTTISNTVNLPAGDYVTASRNAFAIGYVYGGGVQYALTPQYSIGLEALKYDLGSQDAVSTANFFTYVQQKSGAITVLSNSPEVVSKANFSGFQLRLTAIYEFDANASKSAYSASSDPAADVPITVGMRAGTSFGSTRMSLYDATGSTMVSRLTYHNSNAFTVEPFFDLEMPSWNMYVTGYFGTGALHGANLQDEDFPPGINPYSSTNSPVSDSNVTYATVDVGYNALQTSWYKLGGFVGFNYIGNAYNAFGCTQTASNSQICTPGQVGSANLTISDSYSWEGVRLGISGALTLPHGFTISGDAAWLPYVALSGTNDHWLRMPGDFASGIPESGSGSSSFELEGRVDYTIAPNLDIGAGMRYWSLNANGHMNFQDVVSYTSPGMSAQVAKFQTQQTQAFVETGYHF